MARAASTPERTPESRMIVARPAASAAIAGSASMEAGSASI
jgi:hypothetical protein